LTLFVSYIIRRRVRDLIALPNTWIMALAVASGVSAILIVLLAFTNLPFYFMNGKQIEITGHFVNCAPTKTLVICYQWTFRDDGSGKYYVVTNLQQTLDSNPELSHSIHLPNFEGGNSQYRIIGVLLMAVL
jgi:hypothetical protein